MFGGCADSENLDDKKEPPCSHHTADRCEPPAQFPTNNAIPCRVGKGCCLKENWIPDTRLGLYRLHQQLQASAKPASLIPPDNSIQSEMNRHTIDSNAAAAVGMRETAIQVEGHSQDGLDAADDDSVEATETVLDLEEPIQISQKRGNVSTEAKCDHEHICNQSVCLCPKIPKLSDEYYESLRPLRQQEEASRDITIEVKTNDRMSASVVSTRSSHDVMSYCSVQNLFQVKELPCIEGGDRDGCPSRPFADTLEPNLNDCVYQGYSHKPQCRVRRSHSNEDLEQEMIRALKRTPSAAKDNSYSSNPAAQQLHTADRVAENDPSALCSFRFCRQNWTELVVQKVSSSADGYTLTGISSVTSVGSTLSEPQASYEERLFSPMPEEELTHSPPSDPRTLCTKQVAGPPTDLPSLCKDRVSSIMAETQLLREEPLSSSEPESRPLCKEMISSSEPDFLPFPEEQVSSSVPEPPVFCEERVSSSGADSPSFGEQRVASSVAFSSSFCGARVLPVTSDPRPSCTGRASSAMYNPQLPLGQEAFGLVSSHQSLCGQEPFSPVTEHQHFCEGQTSPRVCDPQAYCEELLATSPLFERKRSGGELLFFPVNEPKRVCLEHASFSESVPDPFCKERVQARSRLSQSKSVCKEAPSSSVLSTVHESQHLSEDRTHVKSPTVHERDTSIQQSHETGLSDLHCPTTSHRKEDSQDSMAPFSHVVGDRCVSSSPLLKHLAAENNVLSAIGSKRASKYTKFWNDLNVDDTVYGHIDSGQPQGETVGVENKRQQPANTKEQIANESAPWLTGTFHRAVTAADRSVSSLPGELPALVHGTGCIASQLHSWHSVEPQIGWLYNTGINATQNSSDNVTEDTQPIDADMICSVQNSSKDRATTGIQTSNKAVTDSIRESSNGERSTLTVGTQTVFNTLEADPAYKSRGQATNDEVCGSREQYPTLEAQQQEWEGAFQRQSRTRPDQTPASSGLRSIFELLHSSCPFLQRLGINQLSHEHVRDKTEAELHHSDSKQHSNIGQRDDFSEAQFMEARYQRGSHYEGHPLRQFWQRARSRNHQLSKASMFSENHGQDTRCEGEDEDSTQGAGESRQSKTTSSLELDQNLRLANATAIRNLSSSRPFVPLPGKCPSTRGGVSNEVRTQTKSAGRNKQIESLETASGSGYCSTRPSVRSGSVSRTSFSLVSASEHSVRNVDRTQRTCSSSAPAEMHASVHFSAYQGNTNARSETCARNMDVLLQFCTPADQNSLPVTARTRRETSGDRRSRSRSPSKRIVEASSSDASSGSVRSCLSSHPASVCRRSACARRAMDRSSSEGSFQSHKGRSGSPRTGSERKGSCPLEGACELQAADLTMLDQPIGRQICSTLLGGHMSTMSSDISVEEEEFLLTAEASPVRKRESICEICLGINSDNESRPLAKNVDDKEEMEKFLIIDIIGKTSPQTLPLFDNTVGPSTDTARRKSTVIANQRIRERFHNFSNNTVIPSVSTSRESDRAVNALHHDKSNVNDKNKTTSKNPTAQRKMNFTLDQASQITPNVRGRRMLPIFSLHNPDVSPFFETNSFTAQSDLPPHVHFCAERERNETTNKKEHESLGNSSQTDAAESQLPSKARSAAGRKRVYVGPFSGVGSSSKAGTADSQRDFSPDANTLTSQANSVNTDMFGDRMPEEQPRSDRKSTGRNIQHPKHLSDPKQDMAEKEEEGHHHQREQEKRRQRDMPRDPEAPSGTRRTKSKNIAFKVRMRR